MNDYLSKIPSNLWQFNVHKILKIGTDCSGIEAPIMALDLIESKKHKKLFQHIFSSEIDIKLKKFIETNFAPTYIYDDLMNRSTYPKVDIYVAGFPCQSFSTSGKQLGFNDPHGTIFFGIYEYISKSLPTVFILENVKNLQYHDGGQTFEIIMQYLNSIGKYNIYYKVLNTLDYGIPQSRNRIYIVGILKKSDKKFEFPNYIIKYTPIDRLLLPSVGPKYSLSKREQTALNDMLKYDQKLKQNPRGNWIINLDVSDYTRGRRYLDYSPCLYTRCKYYLLKHHRHIYPDEALILQGINVNNYNWDMFSNEYHIYKVAGNTMSVNIMVVILLQIFKYVKF